ncbi:SH3 domain-containing protein [soil metagenome]
MSRKRRALPLPLTLAAVALAALLCAGAEPSAVMPDGRPTPTRQPVPRWLSLKSSEVRARTGPGLDYHILWEYHAAGLPVQVIAETLEWRKICDPDGAIAWVHRSVVSSRRSAFNPSAQEAPIRSGRSTAASVVARLGARSTLSLDECRDGWCHVGGRKVHGWMPQQAIVGGESQALCDANRPAGPAAP